jgi:hypothetical protein
MAALAVLVSIPAFTYVVATGLALNDCPDTVNDFNFSDVKTTLVNTLLIECFIGATYAFPITRQLTAETAAS